MKLIALLALLAMGLFAAGVWWPLDRPAAARDVHRLLINNVAIVDVESGRVRANQHILIKAGEIVSTGQALTIPDVETVDARGLYAIPGLFDMHVHSFKMAPELMHPLFVAAGVTAVRDMGGCIGLADAWVACVEDKRSWHESVARGEHVGPRYDHVTGLAIDGGAELPDGVPVEYGAATATGARARVTYDAARGIDFLKPYTMLPPEGYFALAEAARESDLYLAGHQPLAVSALEAISAGQRSIEHAFLFIWDCFPDMAELRQAENARSVYTHELRKRMLREHDPGLCSIIHDAMRSAEVAYVPTHTTRKHDAYASDAEFHDDDRLQYVPAPLRIFWRQDADNMADRAGADGLDSYREFYEFGLQQTGVAHRAGVKIMAGTDTPDSYVFTGTGLHDELVHLQRAGLAPVDALRAATSVPAEFLGMAGRAGTIAAGARADIVLLTENPLSDIRAVRSVDTVVLAGRVYDRQTLDSMLETVADNAGSWSMWPKFAWQMVRSPIMLKQFAD